MVKSERVRKLMPWILTAAFIVLLSYFNYMRYVNNYYTNFDLGLGYRLSYIFSTTLAPVNWPDPNYLVSAIPYTKMFYFVTGLTMLIYDSPITMLIDQTVVVGIGSYAVYEITRLKTNDFRLSLGMQVVYFLFPSTYGYMAQGGNYMVFLEGLLLLNYMFYLKRRPFLFAASGVLGVITNTWAPGIFILLYMLEWINSKSIRAWLLDLRHLGLNAANSLRKRDVSSRAAGSILIRMANDLRQLVQGASSRLRRMTNHMGIAMTFLVLFCFSVFALSVHFYTLHGLIASSRVSSNAASQMSPLGYLLSGGSLAKLLALGGQLAPFFLVPLLSVFVLPVIAYFVILILFTNYYPYYNPFEQYPYQYAGFLFISTAVSLGRVKDKALARRVLVLMLVSSTIFFLIISPFSVSNIVSGQLGSELANSTLNNEINHAYSLIPVHSSVFIQNDMPQLMNRDQVYMSGYYYNETVDYAAINPLPLNNIARLFGGFSVSEANHFADNASYGIFASVHGVVIFKLNYNGTPVYYVAADYSANVGKSFAQGQPIFFAKYGSSQFTVSPGRYDVTFVLSAVNSSDLPSSFQFRAVSGNSTMEVENSSAIVYSSQSDSYSVTFSFSSPDFKIVELGLFAVSSYFSQGTFTLDAVLVHQTGS